MSAFAKWYVAKLKTYPFMTNMGSALLVMTGGDLLAQELEASGVETNAHEELEMHRYGTSHAHSFGDASSTSQSIRIDKQAQHAMAYSATKPQAGAPALVSALHDEYRLLSWDPVRTSVMVAWSVGAYTPFYLFIFRLYERYLPKATALGIASRVGLSFLLSIPINTVFYIYGTTIHHAFEWMAVKQEWRLELADMGLLHGSSDSCLDAVPFDWAALWAKCRLKLENELPTTIMTSAQLWIPVNFGTFTLVPPHLRPLSLLFFSVFWNCYLSLSQHRDMDIS